MKKKKLRYLPGVISIVGLPVLLFFWGPKDPVKYNTINIEMAAAAPPSGQANAVNSVFGQALNKKKILSVRLNDMVWNEQSARIFKQKLALVAQQIQYLQFTGDTCTVLKVGFGAKNEFKSIAWVLNQAALYNLNKNLITEDAVYLFPRQETALRYTSAAMADQPALVAAVQSPPKWQSLQKKMQFAATRLKLRLNYLFDKQQQNRLLAAGFLLLIVLPAIIKIRAFIRSGGAAYTQPMAA